MINSEHSDVKGLILFIFCKFARPCELPQQESRLHHCGRQCLLISRSWLRMAVLLVQLSRTKYMRCSRNAKATAAVICLLKTGPLCKNTVWLNRVHTSWSIAINKKKKKKKQRFSICFVVGAAGLTTCIKGKVFESWTTIGQSNMPVLTMKLQRVT